MTFQQWLEKRDGRTELARQAWEESGRIAFRRAMRQRCGMSGHEWEPHGDHVCRWCGENQQNSPPTKGSGR